MKIPIDVTFEAKHEIKDRIKKIVQKGTNNAKYCVFSAKRYKMKRSRVVVELRCEIKNRI